MLSRAYGCRVQGLITPGDWDEGVCIGTLVNGNGASTLSFNLLAVCVARCKLSLA
jgi:hypothetical protein